MGGIDWATFPHVCELLGVRDPERVLAGLVAVRDWLAERDRERRRLAAERR